MVFQKSNPFPKSIFENVAYGLRINRLTRVARRTARPRRGEPEVGGALGRSQGPAAHLGAGAVGRPAAAAVHRARAGDRARDPADGRAGVGARSDRDAAHRGADLPAEDAATPSSSSRTTCSRRRACRTSPRSSGSASWSSATAPNKIFTAPSREADRRLRHRKVRLMEPRRTRRPAFPGRARTAQDAAARDGRARRGTGAPGRQGAGRARPRSHRARADRRRAAQRAAHRDRQPLLHAAGAATSRWPPTCARSSRPSRSTPTSSASATWRSTSPKRRAATPRTRRSRS